MTLEEYVFSSCSYLPLFVQAPAPFNPNMIFGAGPVTNTMNLFLGSSINSNITFYTEGSLSAVKSLKLFLTGTGFPADASLPLFCYNDTITGTLPLFIIGTGVTPNAIPVDNSLLLYIQCPFGASLPLYLMGGPQPSNNGSLDLFTEGFIGVNNSITLVIPNVFEEIINSLDLYVHGF